MNRVGEKVKSLRIKLGMTQKALGKKLGVSENFINEVEIGKRVVSQVIIDRLSKVLGQDINDIGMSIEDEVFNEQIPKEKAAPKSRVIKDEKVNDVWSDAFGSVLKTVPIFRYNLTDVVGTRELPLKSNKIEGYTPDKVFYIEIEEDDMIGYRIAKGDIAFAHTTHEIENNAICLVEYGEGVAVRQIKKLDANKVLLISNRGSLRTETVEIKNLKVLARLDRVEIKL